MNEHPTSIVHNNYVRSGYGVGSIIAVVVSWTVNKSVAWAFVHFFFGWIYVFYACCAHSEAIDAAVVRTTEAP